MQNEATTMHNDVNAIADKLASEIRSIYRSDPSNAPLLIEEHLKKRLRALDPGEKGQILKAVRAKFPRGHFKGNEPPPPIAASPVWQDLVGLILGKVKVGHTLDPNEVLEKLADALDTLFQSLNEVMSVINQTLTGTDEGLATIRQVLGKSVTGENEPLDHYLKRIKEVFLVAHASFKATMETEVKKILSELDPVSMEQELGPGLKIGPLRKAQLYDIYCERHEKCINWLKSGGFKNDFLREFEKNCQRLLKEQGLTF